MVAGLWNSLIYEDTGVFLIVLHIVAYVRGIYFPKCSFGNHVRDDLPNTRPWRCSLMFSSRICLGDFFVCFFGFFLGVKLELQLPVYATATATQNPSHICDLHDSSGQHQILNTQSGARDQTSILIDTSWAHYHWVTRATPVFIFFFNIYVLNMVWSKGKFLSFNF